MKTIHLMFNVTTSIPFSLLIVFAFARFVYWDTTRRGLSQQTCRRWTKCVGLVSFCGFFLSMFVIDNVIIQMNFHLRGYDPALNAVTNRDLFYWQFETGAVISAFAVLVYSVGSRLRPLKSERES